MTSIRQQVFDQIKSNPGISLKATKKMFNECPSNTIGGYYRAYHRVKENTRKNTIDIKKELEKIIKDYKQPASARV